mmetsp:Transcript_77739/g.204125  ORF Transcript_77739/g.204125 Transcript_77739/m.204125 type:complete len:274 (+) Transcript_77739:596-1417(+)
MAKASATAQSEAGLQPAGSRSEACSATHPRRPAEASRNWQRWRPRFRRWAKEISVPSLARCQSTSKLSKTLGCWSRSSERSSKCADFSSFSAQSARRGFATGLPETAASALSACAAAMSAREAFSMSSGSSLPAFSKSQTCVDAKPCPPFLDGAGGICATWTRVCPWAFFLHLLKHRHPTLQHKIRIGVMRKSQCSGPQVLGHAFGSASRSPLPLSAHSRAAIGASVVVSRGVDVVCWVGRTTAAHWSMGTALVCTIPVRRYTNSAQSWGMQT